MYHPEHSSVDPRNGNVTYRGPEELVRGNHNSMPARNQAYLPDDERGHVNASSLGGANTKSNVVAQNKDVNHGAYYSMEQGERAAIKSGATIQTEKTAVVDGKPGDRPDTFLLNDTVTYADGHTENIHLSFSNEAYSDQEAWNQTSAALPDTFDAPNPGDSLRDSMSTSEYATLMETTDADLPDIAQEYAPADFRGLPGADMQEGTGADISTDMGPDADAGTDAGADTGTDPGADAGTGADPDPD